MNAISETKPAPVLPASERPRLPRRGLFRRLRPLLLLVGVLALVLAGNWWFRVGRWLESTDNAYVQGDIAVLSPRVDGFVAAIRVADNQRVAAGDVLIELDPNVWRAQLAQAEASLAETVAAIATSRQQLQQQEAQIRASAAQTDQARAEQVRATADARRYDQLVGFGWSSRQTGERSLADRAKADAGVIAAEANQAVAQQLLLVQQAQLHQAEARQAQAEATVTRARIDLDNAVIRAPFDGVVGNRAAQIGMYVRPGQQLIAVAPPPERQWVVANFKETQLPRFRPGLPVRLTVDALPGVEIAARIDSLAPATGALFSLLPPENATGNFTKIVQRVPVRLTMTPEEAAKLALLRPGLSVTAEVDTRAEPDAPRSLFGAAAASLGQLIGR